MFSSDPGRRIFCGCSVGAVKALGGTVRRAWGSVWVCSCTVIGEAVGRALVASLTAAWKNAAARDWPAGVTAPDEGRAATAGRPVGRTVLMTQLIAWLMQSARAWLTSF